ncbi:TonB-dependent receptor [Rhodanobacter sp. A1T4]|jgi:iron complex outermembrane receptor protein|uniref:TonB-dependent siderophore receptor n=1 Tax=Rhodanobacter sp. A1T4 TaxID=2723087 RepID=UPI00160760DC|nr:TonB-dependent receptor [Rhodanobacter sp. A1T4]MBB6247063.1 iron complex outermembrane receptor protein [Rhodanobacter sp. A1T4]
MGRIALLIVCACLSLPVNTVGAAETPARVRSTVAHTGFAIPSQSLATALVAFGKQANVQVLTASETIASLRSTGIKGMFTVDAALTTLLQNTNLSYAFIDAETVVVKPAVPTSPKGGKAASSAVAARVKLLAPVDATGLAHDEGYLADVTSAATRSDESLIDVPQSISIVTRDLMDSQQIRTVADAVRNVAGVQSLDGSDGLPLFQIRGFYTGNGMTDGMFNSIDGSGDYPPLIGVERVEVVKGPEAIVGDSSSNDDFGGLINVVMKKPQSTPVHELSYTVGRYGDVQLGVDLAGPLGNNNGLTYRLVLSGEYADHTAQGYHGQRSSYVAPSIGWQGDSTKLIVGVQRTVNRVPIPDHTILLDDSVGSSSPPGILLGNPSDHSTFQTSRFYYLFEQQLGNDWMIRSRGQYVHQRTNLQTWILDDPTPDGDVDATAESYRYADAYYTLQNDITATFYQGMLTHNVTVGFDYSRSRVGSSDYVFNDAGSGPYNIFSSPSLLPVRAVLDPTTDFYQPGSAWSTDSGLFLQDQITVGQHWELLLALRRSAYELSTYDENDNPWNLQKAQWVPNAGLVYKMTPNIAFYGSTASGFQPDTLLGKNGRPLAPAMSRQIEAGAKFNLFDNRVRLTASWYRIMLDRSVDLFSLEPPYFAIPGPGQTNRGVEIEFTGRIAPGMDITSSYTQARVLNHDGTLATGSPRQRFNLWASYRVQSGVLQGWGAAAGVLARSRSLGQTTDDDTYFHIPGQASVDANVSYQAHQWSMTLGVKNLFGRRLYSDDFDETFVPLRNRRSLLLTGTYDF